MRRLWVLFLVCSASSAGCAGSATSERWNAFTLPLGREHALSGRVYDVRAGEFVAPEELARRVADAHFVVLGETHDNRDHHQLQAELVRRFLAGQRPAALAFEMLDETLDPVLSRPFRDPDALARAVDWQASGWPDFALYRPIFAVGFSAGVQLVAASPSDEHVRASMAGVDPAQAAALKLDQPLSAAAQKQLEREIVESHCGHASAAMVQGMSRAQSYKDAFMAQRLRQAGRPAVLIAGRGHAGSDRGVPHFLRLGGAEPVLSVGLVEVRDGANEPRAYEPAVFDYVVFTPRASDDDPCEQFREQLKRMHAE